MGRSRTVRGFGARGGAGGRFQGSVQLGRSRTIRRSAPQRWTPRAGGALTPTGAIRGRDGQGSANRPRAARRSHRPSLARARCGAIAPGTARIKIPQPARASPSACAPNGCRVASVWTRGEVAGFQRGAGSRSTGSCATCSSQSAKASLALTRGYPRPRSLPGAPQEGARHAQGRSGILRSVPPGAPRPTGGPPPPSPKRPGRCPKPPRTNGRAPASRTKGPSWLRTPKRGSRPTAAPSSRPERGVPPARVHRDPSGLEVRHDTSAADRPQALSCLWAEFSRGPQVLHRTRSTAVL